MMDLSMSELADSIAVMVTFSYLIFFTSFDKLQGALDLSKLIDVLLVRVSVKHTLHELNKVAALGGLTLLGAAFLCINTPHIVFVASRPIFNQMLNRGSRMCLVHGVFSAVNYWERFNKSDMRFPMLMGALTACLLLLLTPFDCMTTSDFFATPIHFISNAQHYGLASLAVLAMGTLHFMWMERATKTGLEIRWSGNYLGARPFALLAVAVAGMAMIMILVSELSARSG